MSVLVVIVAAVCMQSTGRCETRLPSCGDLHYSDEQWNAAIERAQKKLENQGTHVQDLDSPDFVALFNQVAAELGCRLPEGQEPTFNTRIPGQPGPSPSPPPDTPQ